MTYRRKVRTIAEKYMDLFGLFHWRLTKVHIGIPKHIKRELAAHYPEARNGFYACVYPTSRNTFVMAIARDIADAKLESIIAHEVSHILLHNLFEATKDGRKYDAKNQLETVCDRIARAVIQCKCA